MPKLPVAVAALAGCAALLTLAPAASAAPTAADRAPVRVHLSHGGVVAPASVHPGRANLHNSGYGAIIVVQPRGNHGAADLARDVKSSGPGALVRDFDFVAELLPHQSAFAFLGRGHALLIGAGSGKVTSMRVAGTRQDAPVGPSQPIDLDRGNRLQVPANLPANGLLLVRNASPRVDALIALRVGDDVSQQTIDAFVAHPSPQGMFDLHVADLRSFGLVAPHQRTWLTYQLPAGRWIVVAVGLRHHVRFIRSGGVAGTTVR